MMQSESLDENLRNATPPAEARSEIEEYLEVSEQRRRLFPRAALVGLGAGLVAALFRAALAAGDTLRNGLIAWAKNYPLWGWIFPILFSMTGAVVSVVLVRRSAREASGGVFPPLRGVLHRLRTWKGRRALPVKFIA